MNLSQAIANKFHVHNHWQRGYNDSEWFPIKCPLHNDESASAGLNFHSKIFNCFAPDCGSMPFWKLAKHLEIHYEENGEEQNGIDFTDFLDNFVENGTKARPLVLRKQVEAYTNFLLERQLRPEAVEECGGQYISDESHQDYGHLVFTYGVDKNGQPKFVKRRVIGTGDRFRNSTTDGTESKALFGKHFASYNTVILLEGVTDYITLWQESYRNIVASFGAKFSKQQAYLLRNKIIFILYDRDYDGFSGANRAEELLKELGCTVIKLEIPEEYGESGKKIDVNSAYCYKRIGFLDWLAQSIRKYSIYDNDYISTTFLGTTETIRRFSTNLPILDSNTNGGFPIGLHAIAGKEGIGKSSFLIYLAIKAAQQGNKVLLVSYELSKDQMWSRIASHFDNNCWSDIEDNHVMSPNTEEVIKELSSLIRVERDWTIDEVKAASNNFDVIGIDYIQRMPYDGSDERAGIKKNTYLLGDLAYQKDGKIIFLLSSMPEQGTTVFKETNVIKYAVQTGWILHRITGNILQLENIKNTRGKKGWSTYMDMDYGHQKPREVPPPELSNFTKE